jgi:POT family proton-dependent oligopeptide transporter
LAYLILTTSEVLVSVTALEFAYTSGPRFSRSFSTSFYLLSVALGNAVTAACATFVPPLLGFSSLYFLFYSGLAILCAGALFFCRNFYGE